jgi:hypothetical protein
MASAKILFQPNCPGEERVIAISLKKGTHAQGMVKPLPVKDEIGKAGEISLRPNIRRGDRSIKPQSMNLFSYILFPMVRTCQAAVNQRSTSYDGGHTLFSFFWTGVPLYQLRQH